MKSKKTMTRTPAKSVKSAPKTSKKIDIDPVPLTETRKRISLTAKEMNYSTQDVATRAYFISLERGGNADENWVLAEEEFKAGLWG